MFFVLTFLRNGNQVIFVNIVRLLGTLTFYKTHIKNNAQGLQQSGLWRNLKDFNLRVFFGNGVGIHIRVDGIEPCKVVYLVGMLQSNVIFHKKNQPKVKLGRAPLCL